MPGAKVSGGSNDFPDGHANTKLVIEPVVAFTPSGFVHDEREAARVELVGIACELEVLTALIAKDVEAVIRQPGAMEIKHSCLQHRRAAMKVLSPEASLDETVDTVGIFKTRLRDVRYLRDRLKNMVRQSVKSAPAE
jgi:hypothetical protein